MDNRKILEEIKEIRGKLDKIEKDILAPIPFAPSPCPCDRCPYNNPFYQEPYTVCWTYTYNKT